MTTNNRMVEEVMMLPGEIVLSPNNHRRSQPRQADALLQLLASIGWVEGVLVNRRTGRLIDGEKRVLLARVRDGKTPIPVSVVDLSEEEEALVLASLDAITEQAMPDADKASALLGFVMDDLRGPLAELWSMSGMEKLLLAADLQTASLSLAENGAAAKNDAEEDDFDAEDRRPRAERAGSHAEDDEDEDEPQAPQPERPQREDLNTAMITLSFGPGINIAVSKAAYLAWRSTVFQEISFKESEILPGLRRRLGFDDIEL